MSHPEFNSPQPETPSPQVPKPVDQRIKTRSKFMVFLSQTGNFLYEIIKTAVIILIIALIIRYFLIQPYLVEGQSMEPNYIDSEYLLIQKITPRFSGYYRGDVIVFKYPKDPSINYIKRIIGLPGEKITITRSQVLIENNQSKFILKEPYLKSSIKTESGMQPVTLGSDEYFVLGDNRGNSSDSREWGILKKKYIVGKAWLIVYPPGKFGLSLQPDYSFQNI